jgi:hypothetical protein
MVKITSKRGSEGGVTAIKEKCCRENELKFLKELFCCIFVAGRLSLSASVVEVQAKLHLCLNLNYILVL